jgi:hypothetical protein
VRCWGYGFNGTQARPQWHLEADTYRVNASNPHATDVWAYPKTQPSLGKTPGGAPRYNPQGYAVTVAGGNGRGYRDGPGHLAKFNRPQGVAVDRYGNAYVADTANHRIRKVSPNGTVTTVAGSGRAGHRDGMGTQVRAVVRRDGGHRRVC